MSTSRLHVFPLFLSLRVGTTGESGNPAPYTYVEITLPRGLADAILRAESLELITLQKNGPPANELEWSVALIPGFDRDNEVATPVALAAGDINANDVPTRQTAITAQGSFLPHSRLRLRLRNKANTAGVRGALVSAILLVKVTSA